MNDYKTRFVRAGFIHVTLLYDSCQKYLLCRAKPSLRLVMKPRRHRNIGIKIKLSLCLFNYALCHEDVWRSRGIAAPFLTSALVGGEWSASRPGRFTPCEIALGTHWIGGLVGPKVGLDAVANRNFCHTGNRTPAVQPIAGRDTD
jgi:hypothetical protein